MFWNMGKQKQIGGIQEQFQAEDNIFHRTIVALERLENFLNEEHGAKKLVQTAVGTTRDRHDDTKNIPTRDSYFMELLLQCNALPITTVYDDNEVSKLAKELFIKDLFQWYAGRFLLDYYDEIDACIIPIMYALTSNKDEIINSYQKYIYKIPILEQSNEEKYNMIKRGMEALILGKATVAEDVLETKSGYITNHFRGEAIDGYKRVITALTTLVDDKKEIELIYDTVKEYLPCIIKQTPNINKTTIEVAYSLRSELLKKEIDNTLFNNKLHDKTKSIEKNGVAYKQLICINPNLINQTTNEVAWLHGNDSCLGSIYLGDNGCFYCDKCGKEINVFNCAFQEDGYVIFEKKPNFDVKHLVQAISVSTAMNFSVERLSWIQQTIMSISKNDIIKTLSDEAKRLLNERGIEFSKIEINIK